MCTDIDINEFKKQTLNTTHYYVSNWNRTWNNPNKNRGF